MALIIIGMRLMGKRKSYILTRNYDRNFPFDEENNWWKWSFGRRVIKTKSWSELPSPPKPSGIQVSIIIINWNRPLNVVKSCIESVLNQDFPPENFEVILVDDASDISPKSTCLEILKEYSNHNFKAYLLDGTRCWAHSHGYNVGIKRAVGGIVMTLQSECILDNKPATMEDGSTDLNDRHLRKFLEGVWRHHNAQDKLALLPRKLAQYGENKYEGWIWFPHDQGLSLKKSYAHAVRGFVENSRGDSTVDYSVNLTRECGIKFTEDVNMQVIHRDYLVPKKFKVSPKKVRPKPPDASYPDWPKHWGELTEKEEKNVIRSKRYD